MATVRNKVMNYKHRWEIKEKKKVPNHWGGKGNRNDKFSSCCLFLTICTELTVCLRMSMIQIFSLLWKPVWLWTHWAPVWRLLTEKHTETAPTTKWHCDTWCFLQSNKLCTNPVLKQVCNFLPHFSPWQSSLTHELFLFLGELNRIKPCLKLVLA